MGHLLPHHRELFLALGDRDGELRYLGQDLLSPLLVEDGPQHRMPLDQPPPGPLDDGDVRVLLVGLAVVVRADPAQVEAVGAPDPVRLLHVRRGERVVGVLRVRDEHGRLRPLLGAEGEGGRVVLEYGTGEQGGDTRPLDSGLAQPGHQTGGEQAVAAEGEEVGVPAHLFGAEQIPPGGGEEFLHRAGRPLAPLVRGLQARRPFGERGPVHLAVGGQRQPPGQRHERGGHGMRGQMVREPPLNLHDVQLAVGHQEGGQPLPRAGRAAPRRPRPVRCGDRGS